jgi:subtilase family serine protease
MRLGLKAATTAATALMAVLGMSAAVAVAYPTTHHTPRVPLDRPSAPTTSECEAEFGIACYQPSQIEKAYDLPALWAQGNEGQGQTIVLVDSYGSPTIEHDLTRFDSAFKLPRPPSFQVIAPAGPIPKWEPSSVEMSGWAFETTLDVEYSHAIAPKANILLVETPEAETEGVQGFPDIVAAENYVIEHKLGSVISQSFGATEETFPSVKTLLSLRSAFKAAATAGVTVLGASGDEGVAGQTLKEGEYYPYQVNSWPSSDPLVTSVGGTQLHLNEAGERTAPDNVWNDADVGINAAGGGGPSHVFPRPPYQTLVSTGAGKHRATPDISMSAAVNGGVLVYTSYHSTVPYEPAPNTFSLVGGTSEATPLFAGVVAIADQIAGHPLGQINPAMYRLEKKPNSGIEDITSGNNTFTVLNNEEQPLFTIPGYEAHPGYDMASGLGTVDALEFTHALAEQSSK